METQEKIVDVNVDGTFVVKTDAGELCRLCANTDNQFIPIFQGEGLEHNLSLKIERHLPIIKVTETDKLPLQICYQCASTLISWHNLYESCRVADKRLREIIAVDEKLYQEDDSCGDFADDFRDDYDDDTPVHLPTETPSTSNLESNAFKDNPTEIPTLSETKSLINETELEESDERYVVANSQASNMGDDNELVSPSKFMMVLIDPTTVLDNTNIISATSSSQRRRRTPRVSAKKASISSIRISSRRTSATTSKSKRTRKLIATGDQSSSTTVAVVDDATATTEAKRICKPCCDKCHRQFSSRYCLKKHVENNRCLIKWSCGKCDSEFTTRDLLRAHVRSEHIECKLNDDEESAFANANENIREKTEAVEDIKARQCDLCEKTYPSKRLMLEHRRRIHTGKSRERYVDDKTMELIVSRSVIDEFGLVILKCDHCGYCSENRYRFLEHYRIHTGEKPFICYHCDKSFRTKVFLKKHIMFVHQGVKNFPCDICGQAFSDRRFVESHRRIHTGERPFVCDICGKTFTQGATLLMHTRFHLNVRNYQCDLCDKKFFRRGHLQVHLKRHNNIKDYVCHQCGKAFVENKMLRDHEVVHSEDRPFSCEICRATFKLKKHLIQHGRTHKNRR